VPGGIRL
jgi:hypothetical protein